jgi:hypothetical protein
VTEGWGGGGGTFYPTSVNTVIVALQPLCGPITCSLCGVTTISYYSRAFYTATTLQAITDEQLPETTFDFLQLMLWCLSISGIVCVLDPYIVLAVSPCLIAIVFLRKYNLKASVEIKRVEGKYRSPIYAHLSRTLDGTVLLFRQKSTLEDAIGSHACSLQANRRVTNGIHLGCSLPLPVDTVNCVQTLKASSCCTVSLAQPSNTCNSLNTLCRSIPVHFTTTCWWVDGLDRAWYGAPPSIPTNRNSTQPPLQSGQETLCWQADSLDHLPASRTATNFCRKQTL